MKYRVVFVKQGSSVHYEIQYRKWFIWHYVEHWHDHLPIKVRLQYQQQEYAEKYIESQNECRVVVSQNDVYKKFHGLYGSIKCLKDRDERTNSKTCRTGLGCHCGESRFWASCIIC